MNKNIDTIIKPKDAYKIKNWTVYNKSLVNRGSLELYIDPNIKNIWYGYSYEQYSDEAITIMLMIKNAYGLQLRQVTGFMKSVFKLAGISIEIPDYTTLSRRSKKLKVTLNKTAKEFTAMIIDSTGLKLFGEGEWKVRKHGYSYRRTWRKMHIAIDTDGEIRAVADSHSDNHDITEYKNLLNQEEVPITALYGDGAYDSNNVYDECEKRSIENVYIPPRENARIFEHNHNKRNEAIKRIRIIGRKEWKQESGYHKRSLIENTMYRFKTQFGTNLHARSKENQQVEIVLKCNILNMFHSFGMPQSYKVKV